MSNDLIIIGPDTNFESSGGDAGTVFDVRCPDCGDTIKVGESSWWKTDCKCGRTWRIEIHAIGSKY